MSCELCGRGSCTRSFHSIADQDAFDNKTGKYAPPCESCTELQAERDTLHAHIKELEAYTTALRGALEEAGGLISGGVIRRLLSMKAPVGEKAEASINAVMDKINAALRQGEVNDKEDLEPLPEERQQVVLATDYDAATARAEHAEADTAALRRMIETLCMRRKHKEIFEYEKQHYIIDEVDEWLEAKALLNQPHPGSRLLELAQIVEGLPKYEGAEWLIVKTADGIGGLTYKLYLKRAALPSFGCAQREDADALARLLVWRQKVT